MECRGVQGPPVMVRPSTSSPRQAHVQAAPENHARTQTDRQTDMIGEIFEIYLSQMSKIAFKSTTMVEENFEIYLSQISKIDHSKN